MFEHSVRASKNICLKLAPFRREDKKQKFFAISFSPHIRIRLIIVDCQDGWKRRCWTSGLDPHQGRQPHSWTERIVVIGSKPYSTGGPLTARSSVFYDLRTIALKRSPSRLHVDTGANFIAARFRKNMLA